MTDKPLDLHTMIRRALASQIELGSSEAVVNMARVEEVRQATRLTTVEQALETDSLAAIESDSMLPATPTLSEFDSVEHHCGAISQCQKCPLGATRTKFVYGVGNPNADVMFVGEAPGRDEDLKGEPFVGRAGQLLDKIISAIEFQRSEVYIANILKCRPPNNRDPQPAEMEQCFPYLKQQIALIKPKVMCALGRIAAQALLDTKTPLGKLRGKWHVYEGVPLIVTYHPAALLRNPQWKRGTWEDVQTLRARYDELAG